jgi:signal transduction histidine kinase
MPFQFWILIIIGLINLGFVATLIAKSSKTYANRAFEASLLMNVIWAFGDALFIGSKNDYLITLGSQLFFIAPMFTAYFLVLFSRSFLSDKNPNIWRVFLLAIPPVSLTILLISDPKLLIKNLVNYDGLNTWEINTVPFFIYLLYFVFYFGISYGFLYFRSLSHKGVKQKQLRYIFYAALISSSLAMVTNLSLPIIGITQYIWLGPLFTLAYVLIVSLSIIKHQLFDLRAAFARTFAYVTSTGTIIAIYLLILYIFSGSNLLSSNLTSTQRAIYILIAVLTAILFQPLKKFFDKLTNKIFYRDSYDPQSLIDELNKTLVNTVDIETLLTKSSLIIQENLRTVYCTFFIRETSYFPNRIIGAHRQNPEVKKLEIINQLAPKTHKKVHNAAYESNDPEIIDLNKVLKENEFEIMARLVNTLDFEVRGIGYIFIGPKRSGAPFSHQDMKILEIIANELVIAVENVQRFEEIEQFNVTLQKKIDEATKELKQSNDKLRALDEAKDEFVSMASHQLRTPLTSIKGYLSMVLEGDAGEITDTQKKMLGQAFFSSQRMVYLISDLLNVSRLKTGKFVIETKPVYLPDIVESEIEQLHEGASAKNLKLTFTKPKSFAKMTLDEMKLRQVIMNFTDNAIYYTPSGGKINVELKETAKSVEFTVKDSGIGVPKDQQHKLFTKFYRADNARKARPDGTGLGLFMAKKVIIAQGGSMIFESKEGKGSTFGFSFPKEKLEIKE